MAASLLLALTAQATPGTTARALAGLAFFLWGIGPIVWVISTTTPRQLVTPPELLGRVSAINVAAYGARPVGAAAGALVGGLHGAEACLVIAALAFVAQAAIILLSPAVRLARQPQAAG